MSAEFETYKTTFVESLNKHVRTIDETLSETAQIEGVIEATKQAYRDTFYQLNPNKFNPEVFEGVLVLYAEFARFIAHQNVDADKTDKEMLAFVGALVNTCMANALKRVVKGITEYES